MYVCLCIKYLHMYVGVVVCFSVTYSICKPKHKPHAAKVRQVVAETLFRRRSRCHSVDPVTDANI